MIKTLINIFRVPELRNKVLFTLMMLAIFRIGHSVPIPGVDQWQFLTREQQAVETAKIALADAKATGDPELIKVAEAELAAREREKAQSESSSDNSAAGRLATYVSIFSGGNLSHSTIFGLGVMPYISASIIFQLLGTVVPALEKLQKEGESGRRKIQEWTRYATVPIAAMQAYFWLGTMGADKVQSTWDGPMFWITGVIALTAGCIFLMWIGEQIDEYGLGQGISLIIMAGIVCRMPAAINTVWSNLDLSGQGGTGAFGPGTIIALICAFVFVVATAILITQAQRRIPIMQAKHTRGRRVYGGAKQFLPLKVNIGGVMPIIFAQSLMLFPGMLLGYLDSLARSQGWGGFGNFIIFLNQQFGHGHFLYVITEMALIFFFAFFWTTVQFKPKEIANNLRDYGSFIPGLRPGKRTADYLEKVMMRMTYVGASFLCLIAVVPTIAFAYLGIPYEVAAFLGGTGLLIVVSVTLDIVQRIETNLLTRNYAGFLGAGEGGKRIKGRSA
ncbi:MAG: protein translocase subunit SecY [Phycisphaerae bacterium]|jgi:preprotein translocase subunit SecY|nr:MAG: protein translocase subunit SecY [Phycisphaerae bacterium]